MADVDILCVELLDFDANCTSQKLFSALNPDKSHLTPSDSGSPSCHFYLL
jgi:hypothetical protein